MKLIIMREVMNSFSSWENTLYVTSGSFIFYYLAFPEILFVPRLFYSNSNYIKRSINQLFVFQFPPYQWLFGATGRGCLNSFLHDIFSNIYSYIYSVTFTEMYQADNKLNYKILIKLKWVATFLYKLLKAYKYIEVHS